MGRKQKFFVLGFNPLNPAKERFSSLFQFCVCFDRINGSSLSRNDRRTNGNHRIWLTLGREKERCEVADRETDREKDGKTENYNCPAHVICSQTTVTL